MPLCSHSWLRRVRSWYHCHFLVDYRVFFSDFKIISCALVFCSFTRLDLGFFFFFLSYLEFILSLQDSYLSLILENSRPHYLTIALLTCTLLSPFNITDKHMIDFLTLIHFFISLGCLLGCFLHIYLLVHKFLFNCI